MAFTFTKKEKLKGKKQIDLLFKEGKALSNYPLRLLYMKSEEQLPLKIQTAVAVPKRNFKSAVKRNRLKRLIRESYRLNKHRLFNNIEGNYAFLFLYLGNEICDYQVVEKSMLTLFNNFLKNVSNAKIDQ
ncbi:MAG TPA: ribonuclease P protein component [Eudoraea sp.]|nr:ribonuclease P protein component [Eudoraea sp.]